MCYDNHNKVLDVVIDPCVYIPTTKTTTTTTTVTTTTTRRRKNGK